MKQSFKKKYMNSLNNKTYGELSMPASKFPSSFLSDLAPTKMNLSAFKLSKLNQIFLFYNYLPSAVGSGMYFERRYFWKNKEQ